MSLVQFCLAKQIFWSTWNCLFLTHRSPWSALHEAMRAMHSIWIAMTRSLHRSIRNIWQSDHRATDWSVVDEMSCSFDWMCILCPSHQRTMTMKHSKFHNKVQLFSRLRYHIVNLKSRNTMSCERDEHSTDCPTIRAEEQYFLSANHFFF